MTNRKLKIRDLTLRDGQQSLFATRMPQSCIDRLLPLYEGANFYIMEVWGGAVPDSVMRYLDESPWNRLRICSKAMKGHSLLSALSRGRNLFGYVPYPDTVLEGFYKEAIKNGLNVMRIFDALNDLDNVKESIRMINELGGIPDGAVCYTVDPKDEAPAAAPEKPGFFARLFGKKAPAAAPAPEKIFTDEYFVSKAKAMENYGAKIITLKDMAGLVNPARIATLMPKLKAAVSVPVDFHTHCTPGYGLASSLVAIINGVDILDTNIWWFGEGSAAPAIELIYIFCQKLGVEIEANMEVVGKIREELYDVRKQLAAFDLHKDHFPKAFNPLTDKLPAEIDALFDKAIAAAKANDEATLLDACHAIEDYFEFPKPNLIVKDAEVPGGMYSNMVAQLKALGAEDILNDAMRLIPKVRRDAGLVPLVTPTSQIVGSQAVSVALDRKKGNPDYSNPSNQFISLVKGEYGHTPVAVDPAFREKIAGTAVETPYDVTKYKKPENPTLDDLGGVKLAANEEEYLLLELLPTVANGFLRKRRTEESAQTQTDAPAAAAEEAPAAAVEPVTGPTLKAPMGGKIVEFKVKPGDTVKFGQTVIVYEAMKMENDLASDHDGVVKRFLVAPGDVISTDQALIEFE
jgi:pyruvate carboxylase subunit B